MPGRGEFLAADDGAVAHARQIHGGPLSAQHGLHVAVVILQAAHAYLYIARLKNELVA